MTIEFDLPGDRADLEEMHDRFDGDRRLCPGEILVPGGRVTVPGIAAEHAQNDFNGGSGPSAVDVIDRAAT